MMQEAVGKKAILTSVRITFVVTCEVLRSDFPKGDRLFYCSKGARIIKKIIKKEGLCEKLLCYILLLSNYIT